MNHILICLLTLLFSLVGPAMRVNGDFSHYNRNDVIKVKPLGYVPDGGIGFLPGEQFLIL